LAERAATGRDELGPQRLDPAAGEAV